MAARSLKKLDRSEDVWEAGMIYAPADMQGTLGVGILIVVERDSGVIRLASEVDRVESIPAVFRLAFLRPGPPALPSRPQRVVFDDPVLQARMVDVFAEADVFSIASQETAALDDAIARLLNNAGAPPAPGIDRDVPRWRIALSAFIRAAPWERLPDAAEFIFTGGGLDAAVAVVRGHGTIPGIVLFPTRRDREEAARSQPERTLLSSLHVMIEPRSDMSADEADRCLRLALHFPPGLYPRVYANSKGAFSVPTAGEQDRLLYTLKAITALCERHPARLIAGLECTHRLDLEDGIVITVTGAMAQEMPDRDHKRARKSRIN